MSAINRFTILDRHVTYSIAAVYEKCQMTATAVATRERLWEMIYILPIKFTHVV